MHVSLEKLQGDAYRAFTNNALDPAVQKALDELYRDADRLVREVMTDDGFLEYLSSYVSREHTKLEADRNGEPEHYPYDETRSRPLCTCSDRYCRLKRGKLPRQIRDADDPKRAMRRFAHDHDGDPLVLQDARDTYADRCGEVEATYRRIIVCGQHNIHPDEYDALERETDDETEADADETATQTATPADD